MTEGQQPLNLRHLFYPKCPYNNSGLVLVLRVSLIALGTVGLMFFHVWVAVVYVIYSAAFNVLAWPIKHCQYWYYNVKETTVDSKTGKATLTLLPVDEWHETFLQKHVACAKKWFFHSYILWLGPIVFIGVSLFLNFSLFAFISFIGFIGVLAGKLLYVRWRVCPTCAFMDECHAAF